MTVMTLSVTEDQGAPAHISFDEDKLFCVWTGRMLFLVGEEKLLTAPGDRIFVARGVTHGFSAFGGDAQMTLISTPARHDRFFEAMDALPVPHEPEQVQAVCERFGQAIVGPLVTTT